jgi:pimeloyl-ACP methyl ester carboxylesterase
LLPDWYHLGIDLPGHGASMPFEGQEDLPALARRIGDLVLAHGVRHVVALSFGTIVALQLAIEFPESFISLSLGAPALGGGPRDAEVEARYEELLLLYRTRGFGPHLRRRWMTSPPDLFKGAETRPALWNALWQLVGRHAWWELGTDWFARLGTHPQTPADLKHIHASTLLLVGENELDAFKRSAELIRRCIARSKRAYVPDVGHLCFLEEPRLTAAILDTHLRQRALE